MVRLSTTNLTPLTGFAGEEGDFDTLPGLKTTPDKGRVSSLQESMAILYGDGVS